MKDNKFNKIQDVATSLFSEKGYDGTSMQEIADAVGLHKSTLFHYVRSKEDLLRHILERSGLANFSHLTAITANKEMEPEEKLRRAIVNHLRGVVEDIKGANIYLHVRNALPRKQMATYFERQRQYRVEFQKIITEMKGKGYFESLDEKVVAYLILGALNSIMRWFKKGGVMSIDEVSDILWKMLVRGQSAVFGLNSCKSERK